MPAAELPSFYRREIAAEKIVVILWASVHMSGVVELRCTANWRLLGCINNSSAPSTMPCDQHSILLKTLQITTMHIKRCACATVGEKAAPWRESRSS